MRKLVLLHDVKPGDDIDELVDMAMSAVHGDRLWPEDFDGEGAEISPGGEDTE